MISTSTTRLGVTAPPHPLLLVDDNLNDVELVLNALRRNRLSHDVVVARHGGEALDFLFRRGPHQGRVTEDPVAIFLDLKMPKVDGLEVLKQLKTDDRLRVIPVVMLTSSAEQSDVVKSYRLGVNAYVVKPVEFPEFVEVIKQLGTFWGITNVTPPLPTNPTAAPTP